MKIKKNTILLLSLLLMSDAFANDDHIKITILPSPKHIEILERKGSGSTGYRKS